MKKLKNIFNIVVFKYIYVSVLSPIIVVIFCDMKFCFIEKFFTNNSNASNLAGISGTFVGFLLTAATVYLALPSDSKIKSWFIKYGHHKIFMKIILFGTIFFMIPIISWICDTTAMNYIGMYGFIAGSLEVLAAMYYLYNLIIKNSL